MADIDFQAARVKMVDGQLRTTDVTKFEVLAAFLSVPREKFVPASKRDIAYLDDDIEIAPGRFLTEPSPLGKLIQLAAIEATDKVLLIGAGNGYSAAILSSIAAKVVAVEDNADLATAATSLLNEVGAANVELVTAPMASGSASSAPYNVILIEGSIPALPESLKAQLADGGRIVAVEGYGRTAVANVYTKSGSNLSSVRGFNVAMKPLPAFALKPEFAF